MSEADDDDTIVVKKDATAPPPPALLSDPLQQPVPIHIETVLRMTAGAFVGYCLSYSENTSSVIPDSLRWLIGLLVSVIVMRVPPVAATVLGTLSVFYTALMFGLMSVTILLYASTVSDALFVGLVAIWIFWVSGLRYGPTGKPFNVVGSALCVFFGMVGLGLHAVIQDGITVTISQDLLQRLLQSEAGEGLESLGDGALSELVDGALDRFQEYLPLIREGIKALTELLLQGCAQITVPVGTFAGQNATVCLSEQDGDLILQLSGGTWLIDKFWTAGVMSPIAVFPNIIVVCSWAFLCIYLSPLLPPLRTVRFGLSRLTLPQALSDAAWYMRRHADRCKSDEMDKAEGKDVLTQEEKLVRSRLIAAINALHGGTLGIAAAFEPRFFDYRCGIPRCTWMPLKDLTVAVEIMVLKALSIREINPARSERALEHAIRVIEKNATALTNGTSRSSQESGTSSMPKADTQLPEDELMVKDEDPLNLEQTSQAVTDAARVWFESMDPTDDSHLTWKDVLNNFLKNVGLWLLPGLALVARLVQIPLLPLLMIKGAYRLHGEKVFQCIKFTAGYTALVCMTVYWKRLRELDVTDQSLKVNDGFELVEGSPPASFAGWELIAYVFATMPTTEGTIKKCVLRLLGTCVGGFSAWALIRTTGDNAIGSVAWLTVTTAISIYLAVEKDTSARFGSSTDFGYGGFYVVLTQSVIVLEYSAGIGDGDELVANRIIANIVGILMAAFMSLIPPRVMGSSPKYAKLILTEATRGLSEAARLMLIDAVNSLDALQHLQESFVKETSALRSDARYLLEDAKRLSSFPFFKVDPSLEEELDTLAITCAGIAATMGQAVELSAKSQQFPNANDATESDMRPALEAISRGENVANLDNDPRLGGSAARNLVAACQLLQARISDHRAALGYDGNVVLTGSED